MNSRPVDPNPLGSNPIPTGESSLRTLSERLLYLGLSAEDQERLRGLWPQFEQRSAAFAEAFYHHLFAFEASSRFLRDPAIVARLKQVQQEHFASLLAAVWDEHYAEQRHRVGQTHAQVGIEPELFLGAYHQYLQLSIRGALQDEQGALPPRIESLLSLLKVVFLDLGLTLDAYFAQATQDIRRALDLYWKANVELRQFAQLASHDLKTPLATVANLCEEALDEFGPLMPEGARQLISAARQRTFRMSSMIDELLAATTTLDAAQHGQEVSLQGVILDVLERLRPMLDKKRIALELPKSWPIVWGEPVRLRESFYNLLSNAVKFIEHSPGRITIEVETHAEGWQVTLLDSGPGVPPENVEQIFAPFRRLARHKEQPGSGLGLYFTKSMIEQLGGRVWAEPRTGGGGCFRVWLPQPPND